MTSPLFQAIPSFITSGRRRWPPATTTLAGRPLAALSFAINYALAGRTTWPYHATNLAIHIAAALLLLGVVRRTLLAVGKSPRFSLACAAAIAALWAVHPLQTESVTYIVQRVESLAGLFYLLALYCLIRQASSIGRAKWWSVSAVVACLLGVCTKEIMATAPVVLLAYDAIFLAGSIGGGLRRRWGTYLAMAATLIPLACLIAAGGWRGNGGIRSAGHGCPVRGRSLSLLCTTCDWHSGPAVFASTMAGRSPPARRRSFPAFWSPRWPRRLFWPHGSGRSGRLPASGFSRFSSRRRASCR